MSPQQSLDTNLEQLARTLEESPDYRVIRRFVRRSSYNPPNVDEPVMTALFVDVETTGLNSETDRIIEFAAVPFTYGRNTGTIYEVGDSLTYFDDPGIPIPPLVTSLTGISDADVEGKSIDESAVHSLVQKASLIVAHNARFDRPFIERRLPFFTPLHWACTFAEIPWEQFSYKSSKLDYIMYRHCSQFFDAHRADEDCYAGIHILATPFPDGTLPMATLLESARRPTVRVWATGAPIEMKDLLKERGYRWNPTATESRPRAWYADISSDALPQEEKWLRDEIYRGDLTIRTQRFTSRDRYSDRT